MKTTPVQNDIIKRYFKEIRLLLPIYGKVERQFLEDLKNSIT